MLIIILRFRVYIDGINAGWILCHCTAELRRTAMDTSFSSSNSTFLGLAKQFGFDRKEVGSKVNAFRTGIVPLTDLPPPLVGPDT